ncbi:hypothetical protein GCM10010191_34600 [Actinomadura vinacea]|uniref:DivIVA domain-containing protein n=1 Tax=Actinomadura vinacea TaxID=115336 RepID=A0ABN3J220_9ACTN
MVVVLVLACLAVLGTVVVLAMGQGGELSAARRDRPLPPPGDPAYGEVPPAGLPHAVWGYQIDVTDQAIERLRRALYERDVRVDGLERENEWLRGRLEAGDDPRPPESPWASPGGAAVGATGVDLVKNNGSAGDPDEARP